MTEQEDILLALGKLVAMQVATMRLLAVTRAEISTCKRLILAVHANTDAGDLFAEEYSDALDDLEKRNVDDINNWLLKEGVIVRVADVPAIPRA